MINKLSTAKAIDDIGKSIGEGRDAADAVAEHGATIEGADAEAVLEVTAQTVDALAAHYDGDKGKVARALQAIAVVLGAEDGATIDLARLEGIKRSIADGLIPQSASLRTGGEWRELKLADVAESGLPTSGLFDVNYDTDDHNGAFMRLRRRLDHPSLARPGEVLQSGTMTVKDGKITDFTTDQRDD